MSNDAAEIPDRSELVYPGHPVHLSLLVMSRFATAAAASERGERFERALEDRDIPGAGSSVWSAVSILNDAIANRDEAEDVFTRCVSVWDDARQAGDFEDRLQAGRRQAEKLHRLFVETYARWAAPQISSYVETAGRGP